MADPRRNFMRALTLVFVIGLVALIVRHFWHGPERYQFTFKALGTDVKLDVVAPSEQAAKAMFTAAWARIDEVNKLMSTYSPDTELSQLNRTGAGQLSEGTLAVLSKAGEISRMSDGAFDVTYAPLRTLWRRAAASGEPPSDEAIQKARKAVGYERLNVSGRDVHFAASGMEVDLGGIAKGYAIDQAAEALQKAGATGGIVDIGGDLRMFGKPTGKATWTVAVDVPPEVTQKVLLNVTACGVATTTDYVNGFKVAGKLLSHVIDPRTGRPVENMPSVTVVAPDAMTADALAVAVTVMGWPKGMDLIESLPNVQCLMLVRKPDGTIEQHQSKGFGALMGKT